MERDAVTIDVDQEPEELDTPAKLAERILQINGGNDPPFAIGLIGGLCAAIVKKHKAAELAAEQAAADEAKLAALAAFEREDARETEEV